MLNINGYDIYLRSDVNTTEALEHLIYLYKKSLLPPAFMNKFPTWKKWLVYVLPYVADYYKLVWADIYQAWYDRYGVKHFR